MYTQEQNELLAKVEQLQKERSISQNEVGKLIGISGTALSQIKNGKYAADPQKVFDKIAEYFGVKEKAQLTYTELKYVSTSISAQIYDIIGACQVKGGLAVAAGDAGISTHVTLTGTALSSSCLFLQAASISARTSIRLSRTSHSMRSSRTGSMNRTSPAACPTSEADVHLSVSRC